jgi:hypothetical protein
MGSRSAGGEIRLICGDYPPKPARTAQICVLEFSLSLSFFSFGTHLSISPWGWMW